MKQNIDEMARKLAISHIQNDVDRDISEHGIKLSWHRSGRGHKHWKNAADGFGGYEVGVGGWGKGKRILNDKIVVNEVCGVEGLWIFSLHELYLECRKGQMSLL